MHVADRKPPIQKTCKGANAGTILQCKACPKDKLPNGAIQRHFPLELLSMLLVHITLVHITLVHITLVHITLVLL